MGDVFTLPAQSRTAFTLLLVISRPQPPPLAAPRLSTANVTAFWPSTGSGHTYSATPLVLSFIVFAEARASPLSPSAAPLLSTNNSDLGFDLGCCSPARAVAALASPPSPPSSTNNGGAACASSTTTPQPFAATTLVQQPSKVVVVRPPLSCDRGPASG